MLRTIPVLPFALMLSLGPASGQGIGPSVLVDVRDALLRGTATVGAEPFTPGRMALYVEASRFLDPAAAHQRVIGNLDVLHSLRHVGAEWRWYPATLHTVNPSIPVLPFVGLGVALQDRHVQEIRCAFDTSDNPFNPPMLCSANEVNASRVVPTARVGVRFASRNLMLEGNLRAGWREYDTMGVLHTVRLEPHLGMGFVW